MIKKIFLTIFLVIAIVASFMCVSYDVPDPVYSDLQVVGIVEQSKTKFAIVDINGITKSYHIDAVEIYSIETGKRQTINRQVNLNEESNDRMAKFALFLFSGIFWILASCIWFDLYLERKYHVN